MAKECELHQPSGATHGFLDDQEPAGGIYASSAETAEYIAQMCTELRMLAQSSSDYISSMTCELATLASSAKLERLIILLEKVRKEAEAAF